MSAPGGGQPAATTDEPDFFRGNDLVTDPYPYFDRLRARCPVTREPRYGVYMVTGYEEACAVYTDPDTFSSCNSVTGPFPGFPVPLEGRDEREVDELIERHRHELPFSDQIITMDPPRHRDHRHLLMRQLTPKRLKENEEFVRRAADRRIADLVAAGACELIADYANPFTLEVIADLLGVPEEEHGEFLEAMAHRPHGDAPGSTSAQMSQNPLAWLYDRFSRYVEDRRRQPRDDVLTALATTTFPNGELPEVIDVVRVAANVFAAGQETTVRLLGSALQRLGDDPELQLRLRDQPELVADFVEETLRSESPVKGDFRLARRTTTVGGVEIPAGATVMVLNGAANRDPRHFAEPADFRIDRREAREHLAFGRGVHSCPGGPLARLEARVSIERLLERTSEIRISEEHHGPPGARRYRYVPTYILRGLTRLHLELRPADFGSGGQVPQGAS
ncbi:MAG TPA: cytochrome P450 [Acidimicrobiales bacterium]